MYLLTSKNENNLLILKLTNLLMTLLCLLFVGKHLNIWLQHRRIISLKLISLFGILNTFILRIK
jgi:hypothetical protein